MDIKRITIADHYKWWNDLQTGLLVPEAHLRSLEDSKSTVTLRILMLDQERDQLCRQVRELDRLIETLKRAS